MTKPSNEVKRNRAAPSCSRQRPWRDRVSGRFMGDLLRDAPDRPPAPRARHQSEHQMNLTTHKKFKGDRLMPWGKGTVVTGAKGFVFLSGNTATSDDYDPLHQRGHGAGDPEAQWRNILANIKADLEELGSSLEQLIKLTFYVK